MVKIWLLNEHIDDRNYNRITNKLTPTVLPSYWTTLHCNYLSNTTIAINGKP